MSIITNPIIQPATFPIKQTMMGIYYWRVVFYGMIISDATRQALLTHPLNQEDGGLLNKCLFRLNHDQWIFHGPGMLKKIAPTGPAEQRAAIPWTEVEDHVRDWLVNCMEGDMEKFQSLVEVAAIGTTGIAEYRVVQGIWSTLEAGKVSDLYVDSNLPVSEAPSI